MSKLNFLTKNITLCKHVFKALIKYLYWVSKKFWKWSNLLRNIHRIEKWKYTCLILFWNLFNNFQLNPSPSLSGGEQRATLKSLIKDLTFIADSNSPKNVSSIWHISKVTCIHKWRGNQQKLSYGKYLKMGIYHETDFI